MISKRTRRGRTSVETLSQGSFVASKGINETASVLSPDTVGYMKNFDIAKDGTLVLRNALDVVCTFPNLNGLPPKYAFAVSDETFFLIYTDTATGVSVGVYSRDGTQSPFRFKWYALETGVDQIISQDELDPVESDSFKFYTVPFLEASELYSVNTVSQVLIYNARIKYAENAKLESTLVNSLLYISQTGITDVVVRALQVYKDEDYVTVRINQPRQEELTFNNGVPADYNYMLDNPLALSDTYDQILAKIRAMLLYVPIQDNSGDNQVVRQWTDWEHRTQFFANPNTLAYSNANVTAEKVADSHALYANPGTWTLRGGATYLSALSLQWRKNAGTVPTLLDPTMQYALRSGEVIAQLWNSVIFYALDLGDTFLEYNPGLNTYSWRKDAFASYTFTKSLGVSAGSKTDLVKMSKSNNSVNLTPGGIALSLALNVDYYETAVKDYFTKSVNVSIGKLSGSMPQAAFDTLPCMTTTTSNTLYGQFGVLPAIYSTVLGFGSPIRYTESIYDEPDNYSYVHDACATVSGGYVYLATALYVYATKAKDTKPTVKSCNLYRIPATLYLTLKYSMLQFQGYPAIPKTTLRVDAKQDWNGRIY